MARPKGGPKLGGRRKGTPNKANAQRAIEIAASGLTPLDYMLKVLRDETQEPHMRLDAAKAAAVYVHPKLANIEVAGKDGGALQVDHTVVHVKDSLSRKLDRVAATIEEATVVEFSHSARA